MTTLSISLQSDEVRFFNKPYAVMLQFLAGGGGILSVYPRLKKVLVIV